VNDNEHQAQSVGVHLTTSKALPVTSERRRHGAFTVGQVVIPANTEPVRVIGQNGQRTRLVLRTSTSTGAVWIGPTSQMATPQQGFPVPNFAGESLTLFTEREVWASTNVIGATLSFLAEHADG
jgi:hypothetical protein